MTEKRFKVHNMLKSFIIGEDMDLETLQELLEEYGSTTKIELFITDNNKKMTYGEVETLLNNLTDENKQLKAQLYCDDEEGVCNNCKHHYLIKDDETELGYYNSRCKKGHYECAKISLKHCKDFEKGDFE